MQNCCDLEVDVNGEETFLVDKNVLASFSGRLSKLFSKVRGETRRMKVVFNDFPGGPEGFELIAKFCYNGGCVDLAPSNMFLLHSAANYMEISRGIHGTHSLTKGFFRSIQSLNWCELVSGLKKCQELPSFLISPSVLQNFLDCLVSRLSIPCVSSPRTPCSDNSSVLFSGDISVDSSRSYASQTKWWFQDLKFLNIDMLEKVVRTMVSHKLDQTMVSSFLSYYKNMNFLSATSVQKNRIIDTIINLLSLLDRSFVSVRGLFDILQASRSLKTSKCCTEKLEVLIGSQLDRATIDDLLIPSQPGKRYAYDVSLILKLLKTFLRENSRHFFSYSLKKVASLIDLYIMEVAPDQFLQPSKFMALATALPDTARDSYEILYEAIDVYFKVHKGLSAKEKIKISCALNYDKLSDQTLMDLSHNENFPVCASVTALVTNQSKLRIKHNAIEHLSNLTDGSSRRGGKKLDDLHRKGKKLSRPNVQNSRKLQINVSNNFASMHRLCA
ncbi:PREDICTED: BTB/POZ domain-containing protein At3g22104-like [Ipomoea nil]|uniref:BTB/POZ domain-containing protein At3g22104-like n=1 Tax=Ipomoea nil TaxID=35883 RepID=UPI0009011EBC|nr:PREDICTED: BTB/POZ domain-containing protein At3g22104-like [Ipomoea nil]